MSAAIPSADVIDQILSMDPTVNTTRIAALRGQKPELAAQLQDYYLAIFAPEPRSAAEFSVADRALVAVRVASHTGSNDVIDWYARLARESGASPESIDRAKDVTSPWDDPTPLRAAIQRADLITTDPAAAEAHHLQELKEAGYSPAAILSLSQVIAFVSYQLRLIAGLRALGEAS